MTNIKIHTNNQPRPLVSVNEIPIEFRDEFDYIYDKDQQSLVKYKDYWYDAYDTQKIHVGTGDPFGMVVDKGSPFADWHAITSESFFSGVLFRFLDDGERVVVGSYYC